MNFKNLVLDVNSSATVDGVGSLYGTLASTIDMLPDTREKMLSMTALEESFLWFVRGVEREQIEKNAGLSAPVRTTPVPSAPLAPPPPLPSAAPDLSAVLAQHLIAAQQVPSGFIPPPKSPDASVIADSTAKLDSLQDSIRALTDILAKAKA